MLEKFVRTEVALRRHRETLVGPFLDGYLSELEERGFAWSTMYGDLMRATAFGEYVDIWRVRPLEDFGESDVEAYVDWYKSSTRGYGKQRHTPCGSKSLHGQLRASIRKLFAYLRKVEAIPSPPVLRPITPFGNVLEEYLSFLKSHRGLADGTIEKHKRWGGILFARLEAQHPAASLANLTSADVERVVLDLSAQVGPHARQTMVAIVKGVLRYLIAAGYAPSTCAPFLPQQRNYALASLPYVIGCDEIERVLAGVARDTPTGRRDYAILLLLATYGLRASEVTGIRLQDIDWRQGVFHVHQRKTRRGLELPFVARVVDAVVAYLRQGRPNSRLRHIFLKSRAPIGPVTRSVLYNITSRELHRAGVKTAHYGPHVFRHSRATSLVRQGHSLKVVGDLLGHRVPEATLIYAKLAVEDLRCVALEIPEVAM